MAIAEYNPDEAVPFWERMAALGGWNNEAKKKAAEFGVKL